jgi:hypothetical protein
MAWDGDSAQVDGLAARIEPLGAGPAASSISTTKVRSSSSTIAAMFATIRSQLAVSPIGY